MLDAILISPASLEPGPETVRYQIPRQEREVNVSDPRALDPGPEAAQTVYGYRIPKLPHGLSNQGPHAPVKRDDSDDPILFQVLGGPVYQFV